MSMTLYRLVHFLKEKCVYSVIAITILILITKAFKKKRFQHSNILVCSKLVLDFFIENKEKEKYILHFHIYAYFTRQKYENRLFHIKFQNIFSGQGQCHEICYLNFEKWE